MERSGQLTLSVNRRRAATVLLDGLEDAGLLRWTGESAIALELVARRWPPVQADLTLAAHHAVQLAGIVLAGELDHVADYLRVVEAQHTHSDPAPLDRYHTLARHLETAYREIVPRPQPDLSPGG